ncbi:hypothetical protein [Blastococcus sp. URHD0036]|uniref:hypothetical protein n=1 Tax=Blastococcus sp. URHD0036 TaxID=1380356 RepID=UPI0012DFA42F|nr:hypothetical protein [Blastococcus sp. URHD0036]
MFRKKTRGQVIAAELQEGLSHIQTAMTEAGRAAADELGPRIVAAREAAGPKVAAAQSAVAPKVAAAVAVAAPAVASARDAVGPRFEAAQKTLAPRIEAAQKTLAPRVEAAREAADARLAAAVEALNPRIDAARAGAGPALSTAVAATTAAASKAAADLAPRVEAAQKAAQKAITHDVLPKVAAAREAVGPALESARGTLAAGVENALSEIEARRDELAVAAGKTTKKARKKARKASAKQKAKAAKVAGKASKKAGRGTRDKSRRWPWLAVFAAVGAVAFAVLRRRNDADAWTPAPTGDGPVPSYREDPVPSSPSNDNAGKTVSSATWESGDSAPAESDMGIRDAQMVDSDGPTDPVDPKNNPEPFTSGGSDDPGPTAGPSGAGQA